MSDNINWEQIHYKERDNKYASLGNIGTFPCNSLNYFSYFKITQIGESCNTKLVTKHHFPLNKVEFYGKFEIPYPELSCKYKKELHSKNYMHLMLFKI